MNKITLLGNLTKNPELFYSNKGIAIVNTSLAVNNRRTPDKTMFIDLVAFQGVAEIMNQYTHKGSKVLVHGSLDLDKFVDKQGQNRQKHKMIVNEIEFLDSKPQPQTQTQYKPEPEPFERFPESYHDINEDEIPF